MKFKSFGDPREFDVEIVAHDRDAIRVRIDGSEVAADIEYCGDGSAIIRVNGERTRVAAARSRNSILVAAGPAQYEFAPLDSRSARARRGLAAPEVTAPMPGKVLKVLVAEQQTIEEGQPMVVLEAMKMETTLYAESAAVVKKIHAVAGTMVDHGAVLIELAPAPTSSAGESPARGA